MILRSYTKSMIPRRTSVVGFPTTFFVNSEGKLVNAIASAKDLKSWEEYVNAELDKLQ